MDENDRDWYDPEGFGVVPREVEEEFNKGPIREVYINNEYLDISKKRNRRKFMEGNMNKEGWTTLQLAMFMVFALACVWLYKGCYL